MQPTFTFHARSLDDTDRLGAALAAALPRGTTIALGGTLGAGKTRLVQAIAAALGVARLRRQPDVCLVPEYHGRRDIYHLDAYRIADDDEFLQLGVEEYFDSPALAFIEWAERVERCLPREHVRIEIAVVGENERDISIAAHGASLAHVIDEISARIQA